MSKTEKISFIYMSDDSSIAIDFTGYKQITLYEIVLECLICFLALCCHHGTKRMLRHWYLVDKNDRPLQPMVVHFDLGPCTLDFSRSTALNKLYHTHIFDLLYRRWHCHQMKLIFLI